MFGAFQFGQPAFGDDLNVQVTQVGDALIFIAKAKKLIFSSGKETVFVAKPEQLLFYSGQKVLIFEVQHGNL